jgi:hypothetical protein
VWAPAALKANTSAYVPFGVKVKGEPVCVVPSTVTATVPVGTVEPVEEATVIVKVSFALRAGVKLEAATVVDVAIGLVVLAVQAVARALRSTDPSPVTRS